MKPDKKPSSTLKKIVITFLIFLVLVILTYMVLLITGTKKKIIAINNEFGLKEQAAQEITNNLYSNPEYLDLQKKKAFLQAKILMAGSDSIGLSIDLRDSIASLEINGASVYSVHINQIRTSSIFRKVDEYSVIKMLSKPFEVQESFSSIKKEPLITTIAPKDTIAANIPTVLPDTSSVEPVNFILLLNNGVKLYVYQAEDNTSSDRKNMFRFDLYDRLSYARGAIKNIMSLKIPESQPFIKIRLPKDDVKIIYRAIPTKGMIAIYL